MGVVDQFGHRCLRHGRILLGESVDNLANERLLADLNDSFRVAPLTTNGQAKSARAVFAASSRAQTMSERTRILSRQETRESAAACAYRASSAAYSASSMAACAKSITSAKARASLADLSASFTSCLAFFFSMFAFTSAT